MARDPRRSIPDVAVPTLAQLGLSHLQRVRAATRWLFVGRPVLVAITAVWAATTGHLVVALALVPLCYGWSLTLVHHMIHGALGASGPLRHAALAVGGAIALNSGHALRATHLQHHRTELDAPDPEGEIELVAWSHIPLEATLFRYRLWAWAWREGRDRGWIAAEAAAHMTAVGWALTHLSHELALVVLAVWFADVVFAVLAGKGPQTNWGRPAPTPLITIRTRWTRWLLLSHNWHLEHHLYPEVPLPRLAQVAPVVAPVLAERGALVKRLP